MSEETPFQYLRHAITEVNYNRRVQVQRIKKITDTILEGDLTDSQLKFVRTLMLTRYSAMIAYYSTDNSKLTRDSITKFQSFMACFGSWNTAIDQREASKHDRLVGHEVTE